MTHPASVQDQPTKETGYFLERLHFEKLSMQSAEIAGAQARAPDESISVGWDWGWASKNEFDVSLTVELPSSVSRRESISAIIVGRFRIATELPSVPIESFAQFHAPAILFPYVRQQVTALTAAGPTGALLLPPMNLQSMMEQMRPSLATAAKAPRPA